MNNGPIRAVREDPLVGNLGYQVVKRGLDIFGSSIGLIILFPLFLLVGILIKLTSSGPIFYAWDVIGRCGRPFRGYKFRTMIANADDLKAQLDEKNEMNGPVFKIKKDPRITNFGRILRTFSIDELPQLWSVLKGDMSLVGPRPAGVLEWENYEPWQRRKLSITPGMTCLWQVNGRNMINDFDEWVKLDLEYIDNWSLWLDFKILYRTLLVVLMGTGM
jgi:lipopolysaccharide/colanic/teichoic acid biosynthesis glycosyltransferase